MAVIGPGAIQEQNEDIKPILDGVSEYEYVTILNPLTDDFAVRVAQSIPVNMPVEIRKGTGLIQNENDVTRNYGLSLKNPDFQARKHIVNDTVIKAGQTKNFKGNEAQVAVRQLVHEILQREGNRRLVADPVLRNAVEQRIIIARGSVQDIIDGKLRSTNSQIDEAIDRSNEVDEDESAFPGLNQENPRPGAGTNYTPSINGTNSKKLGRPKKTDS